jgi:hypothetical protein
MIEGDGQFDYCSVWVLSETHVAIQLRHAKPHERLFFTMLTQEMGTATEWN